MGIHTKRHMMQSTQDTSEYSTVIARLAAYPLHLFHKKKVPAEDLVIQCLECAYCASQIRDLVTDAAQDRAAVSACIRAARDGHLRRGPAGLPGMQ